MFLDFDLSTEEDPTTSIVDFGLLSEMFCRDEKEIKAEEEKKEAAKLSMASSSNMARSVLEAKRIADATMTLASLRVPAADVVDALSTLDEFALTGDQCEKIKLIVPGPEEEKLLEDNRSKAEELTVEEQYMLNILKVPGIMGHLNCLEVKFHFSNTFLTLNENLQQLRKSVVAVEDNPELKQLFIMLLKIGNYLNQGTAKGNSISFNIEMLKNLKASKAVGAH